MAQNPVQKAADLAREPRKPKCDEETLDQEIAETQEKYRALGEREDALFPLEKEYATPLIQEQKSELSQKLSKLHNAKMQIPYQQFKQLPLDPLKWRDRSGRPKLIPFSPFHDEFEFIANWDFNKVITAIVPGLPDTMEECYKDVVKRLKNKAEKEDLQISWKPHWTGMLPERIKERLAEVSSRGLFRKDYLFILAEPSYWDIDEKVATKPLPVDRDPLLIGYNYDCEKEKAQLWLIDQFDVTPLEHYVVSEFAV